METFFEGEVERLQFTSDRMSKRALEKKARDAAVLDEKVLLLLFIRRMLSMILSFQEVSAPSVQEKSDEKSKTVSLLLAYLFPYTLYILSGHELVWFRV